MEVKGKEVNLKIGTPCVVTNIVSLSLFSPFTGDIQGQQERHLPAHICGLGVERRHQAPDGRARAGHCHGQVGLIWPTRLHILAQKAEFVGI